MSEEEWHLQTRREDIGECGFIVTVLKNLVESTVSLQPQNVRRM